MSLDDLNDFRKAINNVKNSEFELSILDSQPPEQPLIRNSDRYLTNIERYRTERNTLNFQTFEHYKTTFIVNASAALKYSDPMIVFNRLIAIYRDDVLLELNTTLMTVSGGKFRQLLAGILYDIYHDYSDKKDEFDQICETISGQFTKHVLSNPMFIHCPKIPKALEQAYKPITVNSFQQQRVPENKSACLIL